tara:strand:- start:208 stop:615 length:408 start_codon:yes stop_codon:yes gene_type:complete
MAKDTKIIFVNTFPPIENVDKAKQETISIIDNVYNRFKSEKNENNRQLCIDKLEHYCYVPNKFKLWDGHNVRYIDTTNAWDMSLKLGGFVINDNGYTVVLKNHKRIFRVKKQGTHFFMLLDNNDKIRSIIKHMIY